MPVRPLPSSAPGPLDDLREIQEAIRDLWRTLDSDVDETGRVIANHDSRLRKIEALQPSQAIKDLTERVTRGLASMSARIGALEARIARLEDSASRAGSDSAWQATRQAPSREGAPTALTSASGPDMRAS